MKEIKTLVLSGGGVRGMGFVGAYSYLYENNLLNDLSSIYGTSAGSAMAAAIACGYSPYELKDVMMKTNFENFLDGGNYIYQIWNLYLHGGANPGDKLLQFYETMIRSKIGKPNASFLDIKNKTGIDLKIVATSIGTEELIIYSSDNTPDFPVSLAARASSSLPVIFMPVKGIGRDGKDNDIQIDGGVCDNFPEDLNDMVQPDGSRIPDENTFGIELSAEDPKIIWGQFTSNKLFTVVSRVINIATKEIKNLRLHRGDIIKRNKIAIDTGNIGSTDFHLSDAEKLQLWNNGYMAAKSYFEKD